MHFCFLFIPWKGKTAGDIRWIVAIIYECTEMTGVFKVTPYSLKWIMGYAQLSPTVRLTA